MAKPWPLLIPLILLTAGCSKPQFTYEVDGAFRGAPYRTMAADPRKDRVLIWEGLRPLDPGLHLQAVLSELALRNYQLVPAEQADLWVDVHVLTEAPSQGSRGGTSKSGHRGGGRGGKPDGGLEGGSPREARGGTGANFTVIVQLHDRKTGLPVWQGEARLNHRDQATDGKPLSPEAAVHQLLQPLPTRP
jgi:hypothetical protein